MAASGRWRMSRLNRPRSSSRCQPRNSVSADRSANLIERFLEMMAAERGASANTLAAYRRDLEAYASALAASGVSPGTAEPGHIRSHLAALESEGLARSSAARKLSAIRQFHRFLHADGLAADNPATAIDSPRSARPLPRMITPDDVDRLVEVARTRVKTTKGKFLVRAWRQRQMCIRDSCGCGLPCLPRGSPRCGGQVAVCLLGCWRPPHPSAFCFGTQRLGEGGRA